MKTLESPMYDKSTEEKIKIAAEKLFMERGFSGTRTRDIAEAADINLALLNYYYRSKKNLFDTIMMEKLDVFFDIMIEGLREKKENLLDGLNILVNRFIDLMTSQPRLSLFFMSELQQNPDFFTSKLNIRAKARDIDLVVKSDLNEIQIFLDVMSLTLYPFIIKEAIEKVFELSEEQSKKLFKDRRERITKGILESFQK